MPIIIGMPSRGSEKSAGQADLFVTESYWVHTMGLLALQCANCHFYFRNLGGSNIVSLSARGKRSF
ncbi:MAG: hypothetical protein AAB378_01700 [Patescibacteria group bacterium]